MGFMFTPSGACGCCTAAGCEHHTYAFPGFECSGDHGTLCDNKFTPTLVGPGWAGCPTGGDTYWLGHRILLGETWCDVTHQAWGETGCSVRVTNPPLRTFHLGITVSGTGTVCNDVLTPSPAPTDWYADKLIGMNVSLDGVAFTISSNTTTTLTCAGGGPVNYPWAISFTSSGTSGVFAGGVLTPASAPSGWAGDLTGIRVYMYVGGSWSYYTASSNTSTDITVSSPPADGTYNWYLRSASGAIIASSGNYAYLCDKTATPQYSTLNWSAGMWAGVTVTINGGTFTIASNTTAAFTVSGANPIHGPYTWILQDPYFGNLPTDGNALVCGTTLTPTPAWFFRYDPAGIHCTIDAVEFVVVSKNAYNTGLVLDGSPNQDFAWQMDCDWQVVSGDWTTVGTGYLNTILASTSSANAKIMWGTALDGFQYNITGNSTWLGHAVGVAGTLDSLDTQVVTLGSGHGFTTSDTVDVYLVGGAAKFRTGLTITAYDATTITVDLLSGTGDFLSYAGSVIVARPAQEVTVFFGPNGDYSFTAKSIASVCVYLQDDYYTVEGHSATGLTDCYGPANPTRFFQQKIAKATWEAAPHKIGLGGTGPLLFGAVYVYETRGVAEETPPTNCNTCAKTCMGCLHDETTDCWELWLTDVVDVSPATGTNCACINSTHLYAPGANCGWYLLLDGTNTYFAWNFYGYVQQYRVELVHDYTEKYWELSITTSGVGNWCDDAFVPDPAPTDWVAHKLIGHTITVGGNAYTITENTTTSATVSLSPIGWSLAITVYGYGATLQDGVFSMGGEFGGPAGWFAGQLVGNHVMVDSISYEITANTTTALTTNANPNTIAWSLDAESGTGTFFNRVMTPNVPPSWTIDQWVGYAATIDGVGFTVESNTATTFTTTASLPHGYYNWSLDLVDSGSGAGWCSKVVTPAASPLNWVAGGLVGVTAYVDGLEYTVASSTTTSFTVVTAPSPLAWSLDIQKSGYAQVVGDVLTPSPAPTGWLGSDDLAGVHVAVHTSATDVHSGFPGDPSTSYEITANTAAALTLDGSPGDTEMSWLLKGGVYRVALYYDYIYPALLASFVKNMGPDPFDCVAAAELELAFVEQFDAWTSQYTGLHRACDFSGATMHLKSAHGHAPTTASLGVCSACPECGPARSSYTLQFGGFANFVTVGDPPPPPPCADCASYNGLSVTVAHKFSGFAYSATCHATFIILGGMYGYSPRTSYSISDTVTLVWDVGGTTYTRTGVAFVDPVSCVLRSSSGTGDALPTTGTVSMQAYCSTDPPDSPCDYSCTLESPICNGGEFGGDENINLTTAWDQTAQKIRFIVSVSSYENLRGDRDDCSPSGWTIHPYDVPAVVGNIIAVSGDRSFVTLDTGVPGVIPRWCMKISGSTGNDGLYYVSGAYGQPYVYALADSSYTTPGTFPSSVADGVATLWINGGVCDTINAYATITAD